MLASYLFETGSFGACLFYSLGVVVWFALCWLWGTLHRESTHRLLVAVLPVLVVALILWSIEASVGTEAADLSGPEGWIARLLRLPVLGCVASFFGSAAPEASDPR